MCQFVLVVVNSCMVSCAEGTQLLNHLMCRAVQFIIFRVPTVRESQGILRESGKVRENREGQGKVREF